MIKTLKATALFLSLFFLLCGCSKPSDPEPQLTEVSQITGPLTLGSKMPELTVTTADGTITLSKLLQEKKMVMLNFWFADCSWCLKEFPVMEVSYQDYRQDAEILALNPYDSADAIAEFQQAHSLSFPMSTCSQELAYALGIHGYPTSVVIDREGTICLIHSGAITDTWIFDRIFEVFTAEDYTSRTYSELMELFG